MTFTWADVVTVAPELASYPVPLQSVMLNRAINAIDAAQFCGDTTDDYWLAVLYLAAHFATDQKNANANAGNSGFIKSESVGGLSVSYGEFGKYSSRYSHGSTSYGALFDDLLRQSPCNVGFGINVV